jgi:hypothetical protein
MAFHGAHHGRWNRTPNRSLLAGSRMTAPAKRSAMTTPTSVLITFVVVILVLYLVKLLPIDGRAKQIVRAIVVIIGILSLLRDLNTF